MEFPLAISYRPAKYVGVQGDQLSPPDGRASQRRDLADTEDIGGIWSSEVIEEAAKRELLIQILHGEWSVG